MFPNKKVMDTYPRNNDFFDRLPDDIVISILCILSSTADCPSDLICILVLCKRLNRLGLNPLVLSKAGLPSLAVKAKNWSDYAQNFLNKCISAGNVDASYILGMIQFYCLHKKRNGIALIRNAAMMSHAAATYSLGIIHFNGSGKLESERDLRGGVILFARAASLGNIDALRELGHCLRDGNGVRQNIAEGRRILVQANARELASALRNYRPLSFKPLTWQHQSVPQEGEIIIDADPVEVFGDGLCSEYGCVVPQREMHPAHRFMADWFKLIEGGPGHGLQMCSFSGCGRPETRINEFTRCVVCGLVCYCSNGCLALDWKMRHKMECSLMDSEDFSDEDNNSDGDDDSEGGGNDSSDDDNDGHDRQ